MHRKVLWMYRNSIIGSDICLARESLLHLHTIRGRNPETITKHLLLFRVKPKSLGNYFGIKNDLEVIVRWGYGNTVPSSIQYSNALAVQAWCILI